MAVSQIDFLAPTEEYEGLSTDTKPTVNVEQGAVFLETDTYRRWLWDGLAWKATSREELTFRVLCSINNRLGQLLGMSQDGD